MALKTPSAVIFISRYFLAPIWCKIKNRPSSSYFTFLKNVFDFFALFSLDNWPDARFNMSLPGVDEKKRFAVYNLVNMDVWLKSN